MAKPSALSSTLIQLFEHHISFQCLAKDAKFPRLFCSQTHSIHLLNSMSTNMLTTMPLRLLSDSCLIVLEVLTYIHLMNSCTYYVLHFFTAYLLAYILGVLMTCLAYHSLLLTNSLSEK